LPGAIAAAFVAERVIEQRASLTPGAEPWV